MRAGERRWVGMSREERSGKGMMREHVGNLLSDHLHVSSASQSGFEDSLEVRKFLVLPASSCLDFGHPKVPGRRKCFAFYSSGIRRCLAKKNGKGTFAYERT